MKISAINPTPLILVAVAGAVGFYLIKKGAAVVSETAGQVVDSLDPSNRDNLFNSGFNDLTAPAGSDSVGSAFSEHCVSRALDADGNFEPGLLPWYCPTP